MAMSAVAEGLSDVDTVFSGIMGSCLQCRACEVVCPSLVPFGRAMEGARAEVAVQMPSASRKARHLMVGKFLASGSLLKLTTAGVKIGQKIRFDRLLPSGLRTSFAGIRPIKPTAATRGATYPAVGPRIGRAGFLAGCVMDVWFSDVHAASIALLQEAGYDVVVPDTQTCCGALAAHDGNVSDTQRLAKKNVAAFVSYDVVAVDSAGCGAHMKEYGHWAGAAGTSFSERVFDITELIATAVETGRIAASEIDRGPVAVQDPCHLRHAQRIIDEPRTILRAAGHTPIEVDPSGRCCGAAGIYSLMEPELSRELGAAKADQIRASETKIVSSANPGCEMQMRGYLGDDYEVLHPVELLWRAVQEDRS